VHDQEIPRRERSDVQEARTLRRLDVNAAVAWFQVHRLTGCSRAFVIWRRMNHFAHHRFIPIKPTISIGIAKVSNDEWTKII